MSAGTPPLGSPFAIFGHLSGYAFTTGRPGSLLGTVLLGLGGYQSLEDLGVSNISSYLLFPWTVVLVGVGFLMMFAVRPREWHVIVPALFFVATGSIRSLRDGHFDRWDVGEAIPAVLARLR